MPPGRYMVTGYTDTSALPFSTGKLKKIWFFWIGFMLYTAASTIAIALPLNFNRWWMIQLMGLALMVPSAFNLIRFKIENTYLRSLYFIYLGWLCFVVLRGVPANYIDARASIFDGWYGIFIYATPLMMLFPKNIAYLKKAFDAILIIGVIYIVYCVKFKGQLLNPDGESQLSQLVVEYFSKNLGIPCGFILLTYIYHSNWRRALGLVVMLLTLVVSAIRARRGLIFMAFCPLLFSYVIFFFRNKRRFSVVLLSVGLLAGLGFYGYKLYNENRKGVFSLITERADEDTRSGVEVCFYDDLKTKDWIAGKGMKGTYFCPGVEADGYMNFRSMIETDYLNLILKGGFISLGLLLMIAIPAVIKGLFYSKNLLSKAAATWVLFWLMDLYPATVYTFTLNCLLVWICIGICYSKAIRNMPESEVKEIFSQ
jgi:hypothetical protein